MVNISASDERVHVLESQTNIKSIIQQIAYTGNQEDAFYVCNVSDIIHKHKVWSTFMPRVKPFYAVKCNDSLAVLKILATLGTGFDCASKGEINKILSLGVSADRIIFANPAKPSSHIRHAAATGVDVMTFDNETELYKVKDLFPDARLVIRIRCDATEAQCPLGMKFGCNPYTEAPRLLDVAKKLGLNVVGVSFHVGSGCRDPPVFRKAIASARGIFDLGAEVGFNFDLLDIGGGYPGDFGTSISKIAEIVNASLDEYFPDASVKVIAEPGRFYVSSAYTLVCNIHSIRAVEVKDPVTGNAQTNFMYYINDGVYGSFNCVLYDHQRVVAQPLKECSFGKLFHSSIWGPTCDGLDQVLEDVLLPEMKLGDWLVFENMGAYTLPVASPFNGFPIPQVHIVAEESIWYLLKSMCSLTEDHFIICDKPSDLQQPEGDRSWILPSLPITIPVCGEGGVIQEHVLELVEICPVE